MKVIPLPSSTCSDHYHASHAAFITDSTSKSIFSVHASMYSDGGVICDATFIDNGASKSLTSFSTRSDSDYEFIYHW